MSSPTRKGRRLPRAPAHGPDDESLEATVQALRLRLAEMRHQLAEVQTVHRQETESLQRELADLQQHLGEEESSFSEKASQAMRSAKVTIAHQNEIRHSKPMDRATEHIERILEFCEQDGDGFVLTPTKLAKVMTTSNLRTLGNLFSAAADEKTTAGKMSAELRGKSLWVSKVLSIKSRAKFHALDAFKSLGGRLAPQSVVVLGSIAMDLNAEMLKFPSINSNSPADKFVPRPGGKGANEAVAASRLNVRTHLVGRVGSDDFGTIMVSQLKENKVVIDNISVDDTGNGTGVAMVITATAKHQKATVPCFGANNAVGDKEVDSVRQIIASEDPVGMLVMQLEIPIETVYQAAKLAHEVGVTVLLKASPLKKSQDLPADVLALLDILLVNEFEAPILLGWDTVPLKSLTDCRRAAEDLQLRFDIPVVVVVTAFGMVCSQRHDGVKEPCITIPPLRMPTLVDVIGAADASCGGFISARMWGRSWEHAMVWATCCGALSTQSHGAQSSMPDRLKMRGFLADRGLYVDENLGSGEVWPDICSETMFANPFFERAAALPELARSLDDQLGEAEPGFLATFSDFQGQTLLHLAVLHGNIQAVDILLHHGAQADVCDRYGFTPLDRAFDLAIVVRAPRVKERFGLVRDALLSLCLLRNAAEESVFVKRYAWSDLGVDEMDFKALHRRLIFGLFHREIPEVQSIVGDALLWFLEHCDRANPCWAQVLESQDDENLTLMHAACYAGNAKLLKVLQEATDGRLQITSMFCKKQRSLLHYAAQSGCIETCQLLIDWKLDLLCADIEGKSPLDHAPDPTFRRELVQAGKVRHCFVSYGHTDDVGAFVARLEKSLEANGVSCWIDRKSIQPGDRWQEEIEIGVRRCNMVLLVLSEKWVASSWCLAEYNLAQELHKTIVAVLPPGQSNVKPDSLQPALEHLTERQWFDFSDETKYDQMVKDLCRQVPNLLRNNTKRSTSKTKMQAQSQQLIPDEEYVCIASCLDAGSGEEPVDFTQMLCDSLERVALQNRIPFMLVRPSQSDLEVTASINNANCRSLVLVVEPHSDARFLRSLLSCASRVKKPVVVVPYASYDQIAEGGLGFLAFTNKITRIICFTDWLGAGSGFCDSDTYDQVFSRLVEELKGTMHGVLASPARLLRPKAQSSDV